MLGDELKRGSFCALQMSREDFEIYRNSQTVVVSTTSYPGSALSRLTISGYDSGVEQAIQTCCRGDVMNIGWSPDDCALDIMARVEIRLRISMKYWRLAAEGALLDPLDTDPLGWYPPFQGGCHVDLLLVPVWKVEDYVTMFAAQNLHPIWKHLKPQEMSGSVDRTDDLQQARDLYHLIHPVTSGYWERYVDLRKAAEANFYGMLRATRHLRQLHPLMTQIREGISCVLQDTHLTLEQQFALADGIIPLTLNATRTKPVTDIEVYSRIHSPSKPTAVDISFIYHHRTHQNRVEFYCHVFFKIADPITSTKHDRPRTRTQDWARLFEMGTYSDSDEPAPRRRWHPIIQTTWGLDAHQIDRIRAALFGDEATCPANAVDRVDTVRLLLASVGIPYHVARTEGEEDAQDSRCARAVSWEWEHDDWIGMNIRRACGMPLQRDDSCRRLTCQDCDNEEVSNLALENWYVTKAQEYRSDSRSELKSCREECWEGKSEQSNDS